MRFISKFLGLICIGALWGQSYADCPGPWKSPVITNWTISNEMWRGYESSVLDQFQNDIILLYNTLFPNPENIKKYAGNDSKRVVDVINFMKRFILLLNYSTIEFKSSRAQDSFCLWPYPLASLLSHGQRIMIITDIGITGPEFYKWLLTGDIKGDPYFADKRLFASHGTSLKNGQVHEEKLTGILGTFKNFFDGIAGKHQGVNIPLGGVGNPSLDKGYVVGPKGEEISEKTGKAVSKTQTGHVYIRVDTHKDKGKTYAVLMIGIEPAAPLKTNKFKASHTVMSGFKSSKNEIAPTGGKKWSLFQGMEVPADYNGKRVLVSKEDFKHIQELWDRVLKAPTSSQENIFKEALTASSIKANNSEEGARGA